jgi:hypothetical protein
MKIVQPDTLQVALEQICRMGTKYGAGCINSLENALAVHPGVGVTQLTISKFIRNPPSCCAARHPPAFGQLEPVVDPEIS